MLDDPTTTASGARGDASSLPADVLPLVPVRNLVLFPGTVLPVTIGRPRSIAAAQAAVRAERPVGVVLQRESEVEDPGPLDLHRTGTVGLILRYVTGPDGSHHLICQGQQRFRILEYVGGQPFLAARVERLEEPEERRPDVDARFALLRERALEAVELLPQAPREVAETIRGIGPPALLADMVASTMDISPAEKQEVLETLDLTRRLDRVLEFLNYRLSVLRLTREIGQATRTNLEKRQREALLREQLQTIRRELGEEEGTEAEVEDLRKAIDEAGVPNLERTIGAVLRSVAVRVAEGLAERVTITPADLPRILGPRRFENEVAERTSIPGVATGLAWTPTGGAILFIEATRVPGKGALILTGQLGDVMRESAQAALSLVKSRAQSLGIDEKLFERSDIHVHVPAGAIPKDGPSAGVEMFTALASLMTGRKVRPDVAMTGEISLRGLVLPVGGIKQKVVAAHAAGIRTVLLPARNQKELEEIPEAARQQLRFVWCERVDDALAGALEDGAGGGRGGRKLLGGREERAAG